MFFYNYIYPPKSVWSNDLSPIFQQTSVKLYVHCAKYTHTLYTRESLHVKPILQLNRISSAICHLVLSSTHFLLVCGCAVLLRTSLNFVFHPKHTVPKSLNFHQNIYEVYLKVKFTQISIEIERNFFWIFEILTISNKSHLAPFFVQCVPPLYSPLT